jgi:hypothetical protein
MDVTTTPKQNNITSRSCSSSNSNETVRVRLRMITHQSSCVRARISSSTGPIASSASAIGPHVLNSGVRSASAAYHEQRIVYPSATITNQNLEYRCDQEKTLRFYKNSTMSVSHQNMLSSTDHCVIPIKIAQNKNTSSDSKFSNNSSRNYNCIMKTFKLTENLQSNIRFDVTLKPSMSIRHNRLDPSSLLLNQNENHSGSNVNLVESINNSPRTSQMCSRSSSFDIVNNPYITKPVDLRVVKRLADTSSNLGKKNNQEVENKDIEEDQEEHEIDLPIDLASNYRISRERVSQLPYKTSIPLNSSITFKIRNLNLLSNSNSCSAINNQRSVTNNSGRFVSPSPIKNQKASFLFLLLFNILL